MNDKKICASAEAGIELMGGCPHLEPDGVGSIGRSYVDAVTGEVLGEAKGEKLVAFRFKRRKNVRVKRGHRQRYTRVRIASINA